MKIQISRRKIGSVDFLVIILGVELILFGLRFL